MNRADLIAALQLPASARVEQRIPKKLLLEHGAITAADKRHITDGLEDLHWLAALKPSTIGVADYRDETREYLEIAVLAATLRPGSKAGRLTELAHRAVPYPVILILTSDDGLDLTLAHKRWAQNEAGKVVLEGDVETAHLPQTQNSQTEQAFLSALALAAQPLTHLLALYQGWMDTLLAWQVAVKTGQFNKPATSQHAAAQRRALNEHRQLEEKIATLRAQATKERQIANRVELNLALQQLQREADKMMNQLSASAG